MRQGAQYKTSRRSNSLALTTRGRKVPRSPREPLSSWPRLVPAAASHCCALAGQLHILLLLGEAGELALLLMLPLRLLLLPVMLLLLATACVFAPAAATVAAACCVTESKAVLRDSYCDYLIAFLCACAIFGRPASQTKRQYSMHLGVGWGCPVRL